MIAYPARMTLDISIERDGEGRAVDAAPLEAFVAEALAAEGVEDGAVSLLLAGDGLLWRLNREHRGVDAPTDVLACSLLGLAPSPLLGAAQRAAASLVLAGGRG